MHPTCCACSGWATVTGSEYLQDSRPLATHGLTQENQGAEKDRGYRRVGEASSPQITRASTTRTPRGRAHASTHRPRSFPRTRVGAPRSHTTRSAAASRFPGRNYRQPEGYRVWGRRGSPEDTFSRGGHVSQRQHSKEELHGA